MNKQEILEQIGDEFLNKHTFELYIEKNLKDDSYIDTIVGFCEETEFDYDDLKYLISSSLQAKLRNEALRHNLLKEKLRPTDFSALFRHP